MWAPAKSITPVALGGVPTAMTLWFGEVAVDDDALRR
jgi:hypothetical protein